MAHLNSLIIIFLCFFFTLSSSHFDISQILSQYPEFSTFSNYLAQTELNVEINSRNPVTLLAVDNAAIGPLAGKPMDVIEKVLSVHVCLDWYDIPKLQQLNNKFAIITTLYQTSGLAAGQTGFINVTAVDGGAVSFASASDPTRTVAANLVKSVHSEPYYLSILQISTVIMPPALLGHAPLASPPAATPAPAPATATSPEPVPESAPAPVQPENPPMPVPVPVPSPAPVQPATPAPAAAPEVSPASGQSPSPVVIPAPAHAPVPVAPAPMVPAGAPGHAPVPATAHAPGSQASPVDSPADSPMPIAPSSPKPDDDNDNKPPQVGAAADFGISRALISGISLLCAISYLH